MSAFALEECRFTTPIHLCSRVDAVWGVPVVDSQGRDDTASGGGGTTSTTTGEPNYGCRCRNRRMRPAQAADRLLERFNRSHGGE